MDSPTHYPAFNTVALYCQTSNLKPSKEAVCSIFTMVFGMTRMGREPMTYGAWDADTLTSKPSRCGLLGSIARVVYFIPVLDFYLVLHGLKCGKKHSNELINQPKFMQISTKCSLVLYLRSMYSVKQSMKHVL